MCFSAGWQAEEEAQMSEWQVVLWIKGISSCLHSCPTFHTGTELEVTCGSRDGRQLG